MNIVFNLDNYATKYFFIKESREDMTFVALHFFLLPVHNVYDGLTCKLN